MKKDKKEAKFENLTLNLGKKYDLKGVAAIKFLIKNQGGYCPNAYYRRDVGNIGVAWGSVFDEKKNMQVSASLISSTSTSISSMIGRLKFLLLSQRPSGREGLMSLRLKITQYYSNTKVFVWYLITSLSSKNIIIGG